MSRLSPINQARWARFRRNRRGYWSLWTFLVLFTLSLAADLIANDKPLLVRYEGRLYLPFMISYSETAFGGELNTEADYQDPFVQRQIERHGWAVWAPIRFSYDTINFATEVPFPSPPSRHNLLGTDSNGGDVLARVLYGFRISMLFGLALTLFSSLIGVCVGATQGYYGGRFDLWGQRFIEVWSGMPTLFLIILLSSIVQPNFWWLLGITILFGWMSLVGVVRAEFLRTRNFDYIRAARHGRAGSGNHVPPYAAQRHGGDADLPAVYPLRLDHHPDVARFPRFRSADRLAVARRIAAARQKQSAGAVARHHRLPGIGSAAVVINLYRRSGARRL